jgi:putative intracellular protease/amidase
MNRRELLQQSAVFTVAAMAAGAAFADAAATPAAGPQGAQPAPPLNPPAKGSIPVAFVLANDAVVIDFAGPWEVFQDVRIPGRDEPAFSLYTVAESKEPITTSGGMKILPNYSFDSAPAPKVIVIPAQQDPSKVLLNWIRASSKTTDVTMSVCTGAFVLAATGLLAGRSATTHHSAYRELAMDNPDIKVKRGARFVEDGRFASSGGLSSGIARRRAVLRPRHRKANCIPDGIPRSRMAGCRFESRLRGSAPRRWQGVVPDLFHGSRSKIRSNIGLPGPDLLLLHAAAQGTL